jgi:ectoine hydroxylase-related dioxygenase (phytanoyl-CoA dioxygenase family)
MATVTDPLDLNVTISDQERRNGTLSPENTQLGAMLLHARGYVVLNGAVPEPLVTELRASFKTIYEDNARLLQAGPHYTEFIGEGKNGKSVFWERKSRFRIFPKLKGPFASPHVLRNRFAEPIIAETLGANYYCKFVSSDTCVKGAIKQAPHRDIDFYNEDNVRGCTVNIPIMHCGLHNGPTKVWPGGSHLWRSEKFFKFNLHPFIQDDVNPTVEVFASYLPSKKIELHPGDLLIRDPGMWHRGTPNQTDEPRTMLTSGYFRKDYYYGYGDPLHNLDEELYKELDPSVQELFMPFFDKNDWRYWKLRQSRAIRGLADRRYLGAPLRIGQRWADRVKAKIRTYRGA